MDTRRFHVPKRYSTYANKSPESILNDLHKTLVVKYKMIAKGDRRGAKAGSGSAAEAAKLQQFFQDLKLISSNYGNLSNSANSAVITEVIERAIQIGGYGKMHEFFRKISGNARERGLFFERELSNVMAAVISMSANQDISVAKAGASAMRLGTGQVNIGGINEGELRTLALDLGKQMTKNVRGEIEARLSKELSDKKSPYITQSVSGKIDVSGLMYECNITLNSTSYLDHIAFLLQHANFSAKSYASALKWYSQQIHMFLVGQTKNLNIHLGHTADIRIFIDMFMTKYAYPVSISYYMALSQSNDETIIEQMNQLRFIYELTGYGQTYLNQVINQVLEKDGATGANYLIYNDPASVTGIYVRSTADIITDLLESIDDWLIRYDGISKQYVSNGAQLI